MQTTRGDIPERGSEPPAGPPSRGRFALRLAVGALVGAAALLVAGEWNRAAGGG